MKLCTTSFDVAADVALDRHVARASRPLSEPALAYFPDARSALSDRDLGARTFTGGEALPDHIPVLLDRCVELLEPALTRNACLLYTSDAADE